MSCNNNKHHQIWIIKYNIQRNKVQVQHNNQSLINNMNMEKILLWWNKLIKLLKKHFKTMVLTIKINKTII